MSPEILLTMLGLVLAILALVPRDRILSWRLRITYREVAVIVLAIVLLHYIAFTPVLDALGVYPILGPYRWGFNGELTSYSIFIIALAILAFSLYKKPISPNKLPLLGELVDRLIAEEKYPDLLALLRRNFRIVVRYREDNALEEQFVHAATHVIQRVSTTEHVVDAIVKIDPYFGLVLVNEDAIYSRDFLQLYIWKLLDFRQSVLYFEAKHNINNRVGEHSRYQYEITDDNRLICELFGNPHRAHELGLYKPTGDYGIRFLRRRSVSAAWDEYNFPMQDYFEIGRWACPLHTVIRLFDIMVLEALHANVRWHMWLYYLPVFVEVIEENIERYEGIDIDDGLEWPTPYHYLIYENVDVLLHFVKESRYLPKDQENIVLEGIGPTHENGNIPKSAALAIGQCLRSILLSEKLTWKFKSSIVVMVLREVTELKENERTDLAQALARSILCAGVANFGRDSEYFEALAKAMRGVDFMVRHDLENDSVLAEIVAHVGLQP